MTCCSDCLSGTHSSIQYPAHLYVVISVCGVCVCVCVCVWTWFLSQECSCAVPQVCALSMTVCGCVRMHLTHVYVHSSLCSSQVLVTVQSAGLMLQTVSLGVCAFPSVSPLSLSLLHSHDLVGQAMTCLCATPTHIHRK